MKSFNELFGTDEKAEQEGVDFDYGIMRLHMVHIGGSNVGLQAKFEEMARPFRRAIDLGVLPPDKAKALAADFAVLVIKDWRVPGADGEFVQGIPQGDWKPGMPIEPPGVIAFTKENVIATLLAFPKLLGKVLADAKAEEPFAPIANAEQDAKN
jgi:hypothetical protein